MESTRPGDVLAGRYRLTDLLSEARDGRFWKAQDTVLDRSVALHVLAEDDPRAPLLLDAARASAIVTDPHVLHVLDADQRDGSVYVVNEWGVGTSLDVLLASTGPIAPRRAAWVAGEVADTLASAHAHGTAHGRLNPENVLLGADGGVHVIGLAVDAALLGLTGDRRAVDLVDLAGLLYAMLTGRWAGESTTAVPLAPVERGRVLRPRQVRAGVPRMLDDLCDSVLGGAPVSAAAFAARMREYVGDASDLSAGVLLGTLTLGYPDPGDGAADPAMVAVPMLPGQGAPGDADARTGTAERAVGGAGAQDGPGEDTQDTQDTQDRGASGGSDEGPATVAGMPSFDETGADGAPWFSPRPDRPAPPPELEEPPARPLFADEPRQPRYAEPPEPDTGEDHWIFSAPLVNVAEEPRDPVPGRNWFRLALGIAIGVLLVLGIVIAIHGLHNNKTAPPAPPSSPGAHTTGGSPTASPTPVTGLHVRDFDPQGNPPSEYPELAHYAIDGNPATVWHTSSYIDQLGNGPRALKSGVGLVVDLGSSHDIGTVDVTVGPGAPTSLSLYVSNTNPVGTPTGTPAARVSGSGKIAIHPAHATGRYLTIWLTALPRGSDGQYSAVIAEVAVTGVATS